ncbi:uncharacterized protein LOC130918455 [Corythoichthys intestinalis]|uniref:uncharacterized protein LOC130918455 n=1 Tax=Corythoichthys intestinalis TaxID=161448 RepID=UPI0025A63E28|nr:uncharacterized protein LOC130918455 [Corythoichthys intestinalis]
MVTTTLAALSDGSTVCTMVLNESVAGAVLPGRTYLIRNYGIGKKESGVLLTKRNTEFFITSNISVGPEIVIKAKELLFQPTRLVDLKEVGVEEEGLITVEGVLADMRPIRLIRQHGSEAVPLRIIYLKKEGAQVKILIWHQANLTALKPGLKYTFSHLRAQQSDYGFSFNTSEDTQIKECEEDIVFQMDGYFITGENMDVVDINGEKKSIPLDVWRDNFSHDPDIPEGGLSLTLRVVEGVVCLIV